MTIDPRIIEQDKEVEALVAAKNKLIEELTKLKNTVGKANWLTCCRSNGAFSINIQVAPLPKLIEFTAYLLRLKNDWVAGCEVLGLPDKEKQKNVPMLENSPIDDWISDCVQRRKRIEITKLENKIDRLSAELEKTKSEVQKRQDSINAIKQLLED